MTNPLELAAIAERERALAGDLPPGAAEGPYRLGAMVLVSRDAISEEVRNPDLPEWFPARVCLPPEDEPGNWYRWYDPFIWFETEIDLSNGGKWCTGSRNKCYTGNLHYEGKTSPSWCIPLSTGGQA